MSCAAIMGGACSLLADKWALLAGLTTVPAGLPTGLPTSLIVSGPTVGACRQAFGRTVGGM